MKKLNNIINAIAFSILCGGMLACQEEDYKMFDTSQSGIYFTADSMVYSFGVSVLEVTSKIMELPIKIMGMPVDKDRSFKVEVVPEKTTAIADVHYSLPTEFVIQADSVNGVLPLTILRSSLGEEAWQVAFRLIETGDFTPVTGMQTVCVASFNNIVSPPEWKNYAGEVVWPDYYLGIWDPVKWVKFMEYFRLMETTVPATYKGMVEMYGPDLENVSYGWPSEYNYAVTKYILTPLYDFFAANPELLANGKNDIPKPY